MQWAQDANVSVLLIVANAGGHMGNSTTSSARTAADVDEVICPQQVL